MDVILDFLKKKEQVMLLLKSMTMRMRAVLDAHPSLRRQIEDEAATRSDYNLRPSAKVTFITSLVSVGGLVGVTVVVVLEMV